MVDMDLAFSQLPRPIFHRIKDDQAKMKADAAPVLTRHSDPQRPSSARSTRLTRIAL